MTAQVCESIIYKGKKLEMATEPLKVILDSRPELKFYAEWTSCWRGYRGTWEITNERLYLIDLERDTSIIEDRQCIGCLLYTSPSPRDRQKSRMPSSA